MFFTFYKIKERNQKKFKKHFCNSLGECPFCVPVCFTQAGTQCRTSLNTAVFMALCSSGEGQIKKGRGRCRKVSYEEKRIGNRADENTETQMGAEHDEGRDTRSVQYCTP